jgi:flavoprotein
MDIAMLDRLLAETKIGVMNDLTEEERARLFIYLFAYCETVIVHYESISEEKKVFVEEFLKLIKKAYKGVEAPFST